MPGHTNEHIIALCNKYERSQNILEIRDLTIIVLGFSGFLRLDEICSMWAKDIVFHNDYFTLQLPKSKTDQYQQGESILIAKSINN